MCRITGKKKPHIKYGEMRITVMKSQAKAVLVFSKFNATQTQIKKGGGGAVANLPKGLFFKCLVKWCLPLT